MRRFGSPYRTLADRLFANSVEDPESGCWHWLGHKSRDGYGRITLYIPALRKNRVLQAHRVSYEVFIGPIPMDHDLDHRSTCLRCCIHPNHVQPIPYRQHRLLTLPGRFARANPPSQLRLDLGGPTV